MNSQSAESDSCWSRYGSLLAAVWIVFLIFPILTVASAALPLTAKVAGHGLIAAFGTLYLWGFFTVGSVLGVDARGQGQAWFLFSALPVLAGASAIGKTGTVNRIEAAHLAHQQG